MYDTDVNDIIGLILAKDLIFVDAEVSDLLLVTWLLQCFEAICIVFVNVTTSFFFFYQQDETPVRNFIELFGRKPAVVCSLLFLTFTLCHLMSLNYLLYFLQVWHDDKLGETLSMFRHSRGHMAIVRDVEQQGEVDCGVVVCCLWI